MKLHVSIVLRPGGMTKNRCTIAMYLARYPIESLPSLTCTQSHSHYNIPHSQCTKHQELLCNLAFVSARFCFKCSSIRSAAYLHFAHAYTLYVRSYIIYVVRANVYKCLFVLSLVLLLLLLLLCRRRCCCCFRTVSFLFL